MSTHHAVSQWVAVACVCLCQGLSCAAAPIRVANHESGSTVRYPVVLLRGEIDDPHSTEVAVENESSQRTSRKITGVAHQRRFRALAELVEGENRLTLRSGQQATSIVLHYQPQTNPYFVRVIYMTDSTGDTAYQSQFEQDPQNYADKLDTSIKLLQTMTAERMQDIGLGRHTFSLELDTNGRIKIHTLKSDKPASFFYAMKDNDWYQHVYEWVKGQFSDRYSKNIVIAAYTRFDPEQKKVFGHTALGGGDLGLFGGGSLFTWPSSLQDTFRVFADETSIDATKVHEDSAFRKTVWGTASTTMGATLHEMGHAFGLPHSNDPLCIMTRGFDRLNRVFTLVEPRSNVNREPIEFTENQVGYFAPITGTALRANRWFQLDDRAYDADAKPPSLELDGPSGELRIKAPQGLRYLGFRENGDVTHFRAYWETDLHPPTEIVLSADELQRLQLKPNWTVEAIDDQGTSRFLPRRMRQRPGRSIRNWQVVKTTRPWTDHSAFPELSAESVSELIDEGLKADAMRSEDSLVDFSKLFPADQQTNVAGYAVVRFENAQVRKATLLTGSDDTLRVWLNGELVQQKLAARAAVPDTDQVQIEIPAGPNTLLVEVGQINGGWGFFLRLEDEQKQPLNINSKSELIEQK